MKEAFEKMTGMPDAWTNPALMVSRNAFIQGWEAAQTGHDADATIIQYHEATIKRLEKRIEELAQQEPVAWGYRICEFCGCHTNAKARACCDAGRDADKALAQPASKGFLGEVDMVGKFVSDVKANFFDEVNRLTDEEILDLVRFAKAQPAQEPVSVTYKEVADAMNSLWNGTLEQHQIAEQMANKKLYTTPQQRPWVGLTHQEISNEVISDEPDFVQGFVQGARWADALLEEKNSD
jgi:hypothetical protein